MTTEEVAAMERGEGEGDDENEIGHDDEGDDGRESTAAGVKRKSESALDGQNKKAKTEEDEGEDDADEATS